MRTFLQYRPPAPPGSIVIRIVEAGGEPFGFIREVSEDDADDTYDTEQKPIDQVWRLLSNKLENDPTAPVYIDAEANVEWRPEWGTLERLD